MENTVQQFLEGVPGESGRYALTRILSPVSNTLSSQALTSAALAITAAAATTASTTAILYASCGGMLVTKAATTVLPALSGTVAHGSFGAFAFEIDASGNLYTVASSTAATLGKIVFPSRTVGRARIGFVIINPTGTGNFVGGTTHLDDATVVPNAVYINTTGAFDPTIVPGS